MLQQREAEGRPLRVGLIGAGKFGAMYLAQVPKTPGMHLVGIADLSPGQRAGQPRARRLEARNAIAAPTLDAAFRERRTHVGDDWEALVAHPGIDIIVEATGNPVAAVSHALAAFRNGKHVVNVTVEADACAGRCSRAGPRRRAWSTASPTATSPRSSAIWSTGRARQDSAWSPRGAGTSGCRISRSRRPETVWGHYGLTPEQARIGGLNAKMFNSFLDGSKPSIETAAVCNATGLVAPPDGLTYPPASVDDIRVRLPAHQRRRRAAPEGPGRGDFLAGEGRPGHSLRHPLRRVRGVRGRNRIHPQLLQGVHGAHRSRRAAMPACTSAGI